MSARLRKLRDRLPQKVNLLAVSKGQTSSSIRELAGIGQLDFGESRLQEALPKLEELNDLEFLCWHFIGHLQSNKARRIVKTFDVIHSVDSLPLAERISRVAGEERRCPQVMMQVKFREDPSKGGFEPSELKKVWPNILDLSDIKPVGLMTMAPATLPLQERKIVFQECRELADALGLFHCSMGMSGDWQQAVAAGATWVRVGSALFGNRRYD